MVMYETDLSPWVSLMNPLGLLAEINAIELVQ